MPPAVRLHYVVAVNRLVMALGTVGRATRPWQRDLALAVVLATASLVEIATATDIDEPALAGAAAVACAAGTAARRTHPIALAVGIAAVLTASSLLGAPPESIGVLFSAVVTAYSVAVARPIRPALLGAAALAAGIAISILLDTTDSAWNIPPTLILFVAMPFAAGVGLRGRTARAAREALAAERARIARELHDVVAHGVSLIALQADAASAALDHDPDRAREPLRAIAGTSRDALAELRRLLEVLRAPDEDDPLAPPPGVARLPELVERVRRAGLAVDLHVEGPAGALTPGVDLAVFRVAQEALTNALRHAGRAEVAVTLRYRPTDIEIEVVDDGRPSSASAEGFGVMGMRGGVVARGGRLDAGPRPGGGYGVLATLPL